MIVCYKITCPSLQAPGKRTWQSHPALSVYETNLVLRARSEGCKFATLGGLKTLLCLTKIHPECWSLNSTIASQTNIFFLQCLYFVLRIETLSEDELTNSFLEGAADDQGHEISGIADWYSGLLKTQALVEGMRYDAMTQ